jgi:minimal PKS chain-length factor (CLF/KS beta)
VLAVEQRTAAPDDPTAQADAITAALRAAGIAPSEVGTVFAEGCGTRHGDRTEAAALRAVFGPGGVPVTVPKAGYGHLYGASAVTELACALLAMRDGIVPPTPSLRRPDPALGVDLVTAPRDRRAGPAVVTATSR